VISFFVLCFGFNKTPFDTCALETVYFNKRVAKMNNVEINIISKDTPFAFSRFCKANDVKNINTTNISLLR
jgi:peroxiredoxin